MGEKAKIERLFRRGLGDGVNATREEVLVRKKLIGEAIAIADPGDPYVVIECDLLNIRSSNIVLLGFAADPKQAKELARTIIEEDPGRRRNVTVFNRLKGRAMLTPIAKPSV